jgi:excisionase family DNA binding protein
MALGGRKPAPPVKEKEEDKGIQISAEMQGSLVFKDPVNLKINGSFQGTLETCGSLTIGVNAVVKAKITGDSIIIAGKVEGDIAARKMLVLMPTAKLQGNIIAPKLNIVEGALFQGNCQMPVDTQESANMGDILSIEEVAAYLEIDIREIEQLANSGKIPAIREGHGWKFDRGQIDHWAATGKVS